MDPYSNPSIYIYIYTVTKFSSFHVLFMFRSQLTKAKQTLTNLNPQLPFSECLEQVYRTPVANAVVAEVDLSSLGFRV